MKKPSQIMKKITGKSKLNYSIFPKSVNVNGKSIKKNNRITLEFNKYFINIGPNLLSKM